MVMRGQILRLSLLWENTSADVGFHFYFQFFRSADLNKVTKICLNALTFSLSYMWVWSWLSYLGLFGHFLCIIVCQEVGTQSKETVNRKFRFFVSFSG